MSKVICVALGIGSLSVGIWMIYPPAALITVGIALLANAVGLHRMEGDQK